MSVTVEVEGHSVIVDVPDNSVQVAVSGPPGPPGTGGLDEATADARYVNLSGDTMSGPLSAPDIGANTLSAYLAPTVAAHVTRKDYVDNRTPPMIVLGPADPVPGGTPAGTVIVRTA